MSLKVRNPAVWIFDLARNDLSVNDLSVSWSELHQSSPEEWTPTLFEGHRKVQVGRSMSARQQLIHTEQIAAYHYHTDGHVPVAHNQNAGISSSCWVLLLFFVCLSYAQLAALGIHLKAPFYFSTFTQSICLGRLLAILGVSVRTYCTHTMCTGPWG